MKKSVFTTILLVITSAVSAQQIGALHISPQNPTVNDSITLIADVIFPSGTCDQKELIMSQSGTDFFASAIHCIGPLTYICNNTDSFSAGTLPAGNYRFIYHVDAGFGPVPCTPGIVSGPTDTLSFSVTTATSIIESNTSEINCYYSDNQIVFSQSINDFEASIYNSLGECVYYKRKSKGSSINFGKSGIYILTLKNGNSKVQKRIIIP